MNDINQVEVKITVGIGSGIFTEMFCHFFFSSKPLQINKQKGNPMLKPGTKNFMEVKLK